jgi:hypothetical protein
MNLTPEDIELLQTSMGHGFTKAQLAEWGVPWPPPNGWRKKILADQGLKFIGPRKAPSPESVVKYIREREWTKEKVLRLLAAIREIENQ